jgi:hypothetical protein
MKPSPSKSEKVAGKKRGSDEATATATGAAPPMSPPRADPSREWKKSKVKTEDVTYQKFECFPCVSFRKNLKHFV